MKIILYKNTIALMLSCIVLSGCNASNGTKDGLKQNIENAEAVMKLSPDDEAAIRSLLYDNYLGGQKNQKAELIQRAFHVDSVMLRPNVEKDGKSTLKKWMEMHRTAEDWAVPGSPDLDYGQFEILSISAVDNRMAQVLFKYEDSVYDAITLVKLNDEWIIAAKVFILQ